MRWLLLALVTLQVATCGQKGPLTLPEPSSVGARAPGADAGAVSRSAPPRPGG